MVRLAALVVQVELGDCSMQDLPQISTKTDAERTYLNDFQVLHNQTKRMEALISEEHKKLEGMLPSEAATEMIQLASSLETYGVDPIRVKTKAYGSRPIHLGLTHRGVAEFVSNRCQKLYLWSNISWMTCDGRHFILSVRKQTSGRKKQVRFNCVVAYFHVVSHTSLSLAFLTRVCPLPSKLALYSLCDDQHRPT
ncbi:hypothetical protein AHF37_08690 [Paragonimus kellicotti]|nr:hypothetical protein AHF37_08690 [Paragonimus kellicotti]